MTRVGAGSHRRLRAEASLLDALVILAWASFAAVVGFILRGLDATPTTAGSQDLVAFATLVLPAVVTFAAQEASVDQATFGKLRRKLVVTDLDGRRIGPARSAIRSAAKFLPWQLAHSAVFRLVADPTATGWAVVAIAAQVLVVLTIAVAIRTGRALHDLAAGTRVVVRAVPRGDTPPA